MLEARSLSYVDGPVPIPNDDPFLLANVKRIQICDTGMDLLSLAIVLSFLTSLLMHLLVLAFYVDEWTENHKVLLFWQVRPVVHVFQVCTINNVSCQLPKPLPPLSRTVVMNFVLTCWLSRFIDKLHVEFLNTVLNFLICFL